MTRHGWTEHGDIFLWNMINTKMTTNWKSLPNAPGSGLQDLCYTVMCCSGFISGPFYSQVWKHGGREAVYERSSIQHVSLQCLMWKLKAANFIFNRCSTVFRCIFDDSWKRGRAEVMGSWGFSARNVNTLQCRSRTTVLQLLEKRNRVEETDITFNTVVCCLCFIVLCWSDLSEDECCNTKKTQYWPLSENWKSWTCVNRLLMGDCAEKKFTVRWIS